MSNSLDVTESVAPADLPDSNAPEEMPDPPSSEERASRRQWFRLGAAAIAAAAVATPRKASAQRIIRPRPHTARPPQPVATGDSLHRLVRRITNGITEAELTRARQLGFSRYLDYQLAYQSINDSEVETRVATSYPLLALTGQELQTQDVNILYQQLAEATIYRAAFSKRQLYERMVHFWNDHFTIYYPKVNYLKVIDDREVIRRHALGKFPDLLRASAHSAAMLSYLDNILSRVGNVNENYAREIMELHSLGVDGGYTQQDVVEVTRCLTGWTVQAGGIFSFNPARHDFGQKTVMGNVIAAMPQSAGALGVQDGERVLEILINDPHTAHFIAFKMSRWLLQYDPPAALVDKVAATYTRTGGDIPSMIRDIVTPSNLQLAPAKYRQPYQMVLAALRATQPVVTSLTQVRAQLTTLGQQLFYWEDPDGFPDNVDWWAGTVLQRWNFCSFLTNQAAGNLAFDVAPLMVVSTPDAIAEAINKQAFAGELKATDSAKQMITAHLAAAPITAARVREAFALALSSSSFQWY
jgi:uncharacterized protein (DUF1800 family)